MRAAAVSAILVILFIAFGWARRGEGAMPPIDKPEALLSTRDETKAGGAITDVVRRPAGAMVEGAFAPVRVVDEHGVGIAGVSVLCSDSDKEEALKSVQNALRNFELIMQSQEAGLTSYGEAELGKTSETGECALRSLRLNSHVLVANRSRGVRLVDWADIRNSNGDVLLEDQVAVEVIFLTPGPRQVHVHWSDRPILVLQADAAGRCVTPPLPPGQYEFSTPGYLTKVVVVPVVGQDLRIIMEDKSGGWSALLCSDDGLPYDASRLAYELRLDAKECSFMFSVGKPNLGGFADDRRRVSVHFDGASGRLTAAHLPAGVANLGVWRRLELVGHAVLDKARERAVFHPVSMDSASRATFRLQSETGVALDRDATVALGVLVGASFGRVRTAIASAGAECCIVLPEAMLGACVWCSVVVEGYVPEWQRIEIPSTGDALFEICLRLARHDLRITAEGADVIACVGADDRWITDHVTTVRTQDGTGEIKGLPSGALRVLAWSRSAFAHLDLTMPRTDESTVVMKPAPGLEIVIDNPMDRTIQLVAHSADGVTVFDDRLFGNQLHGLRLTCMVPASTRQLTVLDASGRCLLTAEIPIKTPSIALDR